MTDKKIIAVMGATGAQGGSLVRAILRDPKGAFTVRAVTRDPNSEKARALANQGAEVVAGDLEDPASIRRAFRGAYGAYCVTFYWAHMSPEKEQAHVEIMAGAARDENVAHVIWSTLEDTRERVPLDDDRMPTLMGRYKVPHYDAKGEADRVFAKMGVPTTYLRTSFYWDNLVHFGMGPKKVAGEEYALVFPMGGKRLPGIAAEDIGPCALGIFERGKEFIGRTVGIAGGFPTIEEMAAVLSKALGKRVVYKEVTPEEYRNFGFPGAEDLGNMFQYKRDFEREYVGARDLNLAKTLNPSLQTFEQWAARNKDRIPLG